MSMDIYHVIYDFITIYNLFEMVLPFYNIINDVIMCSIIIHFRVIYFFFGTNVPVLVTLVPAEQGRQRLKLRH